MAFNFGFFGTPEHRVFNYKPRYYDPDKEELKKMFGKVDGSLKKEGAYVPGSYLKGSFRDGNYAERRGGTRAQRIFGVIGIVLVFIILILVAKYSVYFYV